MNLKMKVKKLNKIFINFQRRTKFKIKEEAMHCSQFLSKNNYLPKYCLYRHTEATDQTANIRLISNITTFHLNNNNNI